MKVSKILIYTFIILIILSCKQKEKGSSVKEKSATKLEQNWFSDPSGYGYALVLEPDGTMRYFFSGEGCGDLSGTYIAQESGFTYNANKSEHECESLKPGNGECKITLLNNHLYYLQKLRCTGPINIELFGSLIQKELPRKVGNISVITIHKTGKAIEEVFVRESPAKSAKPVKCVLESPALEERKTIPQYLELKVIARTEKKEKVDKWENYWYYVDAKDGWYSNCEGWVFAEFIKLYE